MALTIIFMSCIVLSSMLGRASATILHRTATTSYANCGDRTATDWLAARYGGYDKLITDCQTGDLTNKINFISQILGVVIVSPLCWWSLAQERPAPFDGTCCLLLTSFVAFVLYICSFSLHLNGTGNFAPHPRGDACSEVQAKKCCSFLCEILTVSVSDMASLFDEANWSLTPLLGQSQSYSEVRDKK